MQLEQVDGLRRVQLDEGEDLLSLDCARSLDRQPRSHVRPALEGEPCRDDERKGCGHDDKLRPAQRKRADEREGGQTEIRHEPW
jgi:hypothetical protein